MMKNKETIKKRDIELAETIRKLCIEEAKNGFRNASMSGLCAEGAMEAAISAIQMSDFEKIVENFDQANHETTDIRIS